MFASVFIAVVFAVNSQFPAPFTLGGQSEIPRTLFEGASRVKAVYVDVHVRKGLKISIRNG